MPEAALFNIKGEQIGSIELSPEIFAVKINKAAIKQVVDMQLANRRRGTSSTKSRGEVRGGGRKPWRQKGTGRARHGTIRSPIWRGGSITFGPKPRDYGFTVPKKVKRLALKSVLSAKVKDAELLVVDDFQMEEPRTKTMVEILGNLNTKNKVLIITDKPDEAIAKSVSNIPGIKSLPVNNINVYDILLHDNLIFTKSAVAEVEEVLS